MHLADFYLHSSWQFSHFISSSTDSRSFVVGFDTLCKRGESREKKVNQGQGSVGKSLKNRVLVSLGHIFSMNTDCCLLPVESHQPRCLVYVTVLAWSYELNWSNTSHLPNFLGYRTSEQRQKIWGGGFILTRVRELVI